jgi:hypothetical protein
MRFVRTALDAGIRSAASSTPSKDIQPVPLSQEGTT